MNYCTCMLIERVCWIVTVVTILGKLILCIHYLAAKWSANLYRMLVNGCYMYINRHLLTWPGGSVHVGITCTIVSRASAHSWVSAHTPHFHGVKIAAYVMSRVCAHTDQNCELYLSVHGHLPRTLEKVSMWSGVFTDIIMNSATMQHMAKARVWILQGTRRLCPQQWSYHNHSYNHSYHMVQLTIHIAVLTRMFLTINFHRKDSLWGRHCQSILEILSNNS